MRKTAFILFTVIVLLFVGCSPSPMQKMHKTPYVVVLSMDGFRWDYTSKTATPAFDKLAENGVKAEYMVPSFPTKTFPNHYTLATGLYPGEHGIVANSFYNDSIKKTYSLGNREAVENADFYGGEPIWVTAEKHGIKAATAFWPGSEAPIKDVRPSYWLKYDGSLSWESRLDTVIKWLTLPYAERPHLIMFYIEEPDHIGHELGPDSRELLQMVSKVDSFLATVEQRLNKLDIADSLNFIALSDHGMTPVDKNKSYNLEEILPEKWVAHQATSNPLSLIDPEPGYADSIVATLDGMEGLNAWKKQDVPKKYHFNSHPSIPDVVALADSAYMLYWGRYTMKGDHGYDPYTNKNMNTIFYARGPTFKNHFINKPFSNRIVYPLITTLFDIQNENAGKKLEKEGVELLK